MTNMTEYIESNYLAPYYREAFEKARTLGADREQAHAYAAQVRDITRDHLHDAIERYAVATRLHQDDDPEP
jgi:hypothetical protein